MQRKSTLRQTPAAQGTPHRRSRRVSFAFQVTAVMVPNPEGWEWEWGESDCPRGVDAASSSLAGTGEGSRCAPPPLSLSLVELGGTSAGYCYGPCGLTVHHRRSLWWLSRKDTYGVGPAPHAPEEAARSSGVHPFPPGPGDSGCPTVKPAASTVMQVLELAVVELHYPLVPHYVGLSALEAILGTGSEVQEVIAPLAKYDVLWDDLLVPLCVFCRRACVSNRSGADGNGADLDGTPAPAPASMYAGSTELERVLQSQHLPISSRIRYLRVDETALQCLAVLMRDLRSGTASSLFRAFVDEVLNAAETESGESTWPVNFAYSVNGARALGAVMFYACTVHRASVSCILRVLRLLHTFLSANAADVELQSQSIHGLGLRQRRLVADVLHERCEAGDTARDAFVHLLVLFVYLVAVVEHRTGEVFYLSSSTAPAAGPAVDPFARESSFDFWRGVGGSEADRPDSVRSDPSTIPVEKGVAPDLSRADHSAHDPLRAAIDRVLARLGDDSARSVKVRASSFLWKHRRLAQWLGATRYAEGEFSALFVSPNAVAAWSAPRLPSGPVPHAARSQRRSEQTFKLYQICGGAEAALRMLQLWGCTELSFSH